MTETESSGELWRPIPGWEAEYEVSSLGRVRSLPRVVPRGNGVLYVRGGIRRDKPNGPYGHRSIDLCRGGLAVTCRLHVLVMEAFVGPRPTGTEVRHLDGNASNNRIQNLVWGTSSENKRDKRAHGTDHQLNKTTCPRGHSLAPPNLKASDLPRRGCLACNRASSALNYRKRKYGEEFTEGQLAALADRRYTELMLASRAAA